MKRLLNALCLLTSGFSYGQSYAPPAGQPGSTAIHMDSSIISAWCTQASFQPGPIDISNPGAGMPGVGTALSVTGHADISDVLSLGDGGTVTCQFLNPIKNGPGFDFAVFENSIDDTFLELAFVEVSSDGQNFFRFPSHSLTDTVSQTPGFGSSDATRLNNLAGKYRAGYGTPFDLQELSGKPGLDLQNITHVRVIDVVGSLQPSYASRDSYGNKVNDPWPTPFPSSGFDLDAIAVLAHTATGRMETKEEIFAFPNPVTAGISFNIISGRFDLLKVENLNGSLYKIFRASGPLNIEMPGVYLLSIYRKDNLLARKRLVVL